MPSSFLIRFLALVTPRMVFQEVCALGNLYHLR